MPVLDYNGVRERVGIGSACNGVWMVLFFVLVGMGSRRERGSGLLFPTHVFIFVSVIFPSLAPGLSGEPGHPCITVAIRATFCHATTGDPFMVAADTFKPWNNYVGADCIGYFIGNINHVFILPQ